MSGKHFTLIERCQLDVYIKEGQRFQYEIAELLGKDPSAISRELKRNPHTQFPDFRIGTPSGFLDCRVKYPLLVTYPLSPSHLASSLTFSSFTATVTSLDLLFMLCVQGIEETVDSR